jgi:hypothetical protein
MILAYDPAKGPFTVTPTWPNATGTYDGITRPLGSYTVNVFGKHVVFGRYGRITVMDWDTGETIASAFSIDTTACHIAIGRIFFACYAQSRAWHGLMGRIYSVQLSSPIEPAREVFRGGHDLVSMFDNRAVISKHEPSEFMLVDLENAAILRTIPLAERELHPLAFRHIVESGREYMHMWDMESGKEWTSGASFNRPAAINQTHAFEIRGYALYRVPLAKPGGSAVVLYESNTEPPRAEVVRDGRHLLVNPVHSRMFIVDAYAHEVTVLALLGSDQLRRLLMPYLIPNHS